MVSAQELTCSVPKTSPGNVMTAATASGAAVVSAAIENGRKSRAEDDEPTPAALRRAGSAGRSK